MRPDHTAIEAGHAGAENDSSPPISLHGGKTQLGQQERGTAVGAPRMLEFLDADLADRLDAAFERQARVVE